LEVKAGGGAIFWGFLLLSISFLGGFK